ncbi:putative nucleoside diphosphate kinase 5 [Choanephora cucurbitarum]|uniref:Nucleoside diphosphate kinase n=1 Tax=Choanephora cucurbitarum TaxID=101091 RepID=A0A1C7N307_9FUNG|nr:putative nucleoside diphosphate kinase 5 [Choanephora cucurbitarum]
METTKESTLAIITLNENTKETKDYILSQGFLIAQSKDIQFSPNEAHLFYQAHKEQSYYDKFIKWLTTFTLHAMILEKPNGIQEWKQLMGPSNYKKARKIQPDSIRALFGQNKADNITHGSDTVDHAKREIEFIFGPSRKRFISQIPIRTQQNMMLIEKCPLRFKGHSRIARPIGSFKIEPLKESSIKKSSLPIMKGRTLIQLSTKISV